MSYNRDTHPYIYASYSISVRGAHSARPGRPMSDTEMITLVPASGENYDRAPADIPSSTTSILAVACKTLCCCWKNQNGAASDPARHFPRSADEFSVFGAEWASAVLVEKGVLPAGKRAAGASDDRGMRNERARVTRVEVAELGANGLLSELCLATLHFSVPVQLGGHGEPIPSLQVVVKFSPDDTLTRLTLNLFELSKTEYLAYDRFLPRLPASIMRPRMWGGDFNYTSNKVCMMLEKINAACFLDQDSDDPAAQPTLDHFVRIFETLATLHAAYWNKWQAPGLSWINRTDNEVFKIFPKECRKHWDKWERKVADPGEDVTSLLPRRALGVVPPALRAIKDDFLGRMFGL